MNLAWIIPKAGAPKVQNVHAKDRTQLARDGYATYTVEWMADAFAKAKVATVRAQRAPTRDEIARGVDELFGARGRGTFRLLDEGGTVVMS